MGCGPSQPEPPGKKSAMTIYGDYFNQDTRALLAICQMSGVDYEFRLIDTFQRENQNEQYVALNPSSQIPMITEGTTKIIGGGNSFLMYLVHKHAKIQHNFYCEEQRSEVDRLLNWF